MLLPKGATGTAEGEGGKEPFYLHVRLLLDWVRAHLKREGSPQFLGVPFAFEFQATLVVLI